MKRINWKDLLNPETANWEQFEAVVELYTADITEKELVKVGIEALDFDHALHRLRAIRGLFRIHSLSFVGEIKSD